MDTFNLIGETLRRLRRERGLTLEKVGEMAGLGRGQLSRIETSKQEATLTTIGKILDCEGVSRREFFRRYDLVEAETQAVARDKGDGAAATGAVRPPQDVRDLVGRFESFLQSTLDPSGAVAQGAIELGDFVVMFRVVPRGAPVPATAPPPSPSSGEEKPAKRGRSTGRRKRKETAAE